MVYTKVSIIRGVATEYEEKELDEQETEIYCVVDKLQKEYPEMRVDCPKCCFKASTTIVIGIVLKEIKRARANHQDCLDVICKKCRDKWMKSPCEKDKFCNTCIKNLDTRQGWCEKCEFLTVCDSCLSKLRDGTSIDVRACEAGMVEAKEEHIKYFDMEKVDKDIRAAGVKGTIKTWYILNDCLSCT